jgi:hypothetical protein
MRLTAATVLLSLISAQTISPAAAWAAAGQASARAQSDEAGVPKKPSAPPTLGAKLPQDLFVCERTYVYRGKAIPCDSNVSFDGENLRPVLSQVPDSIKLLDTYQGNRKKVGFLAYTASAGLALLILGSLVSRGYEGDTRIVLRNVGLLSGLVFTGGSFIYGISLLNSNEGYLRDAVDVYNRARPQDPIELQLSTTVRF